MLILGPTGSGKSVAGNVTIAHEQKYGGFTYIFDIGGSYESVVELYGGRVDRIGKDGPRVNPFALEPTESNIQFLYSFIKLLLTNGGAELEPEDDDVVHKAVKDMYLLDPSNRRLSNLYLPKKLDRYPGSLHFDYAWDEKKGKELGLQQIWRDDKFTYLRGQFQETPALYEVKDKKPSLINFDFANGLYAMRRSVEENSWFETPATNTSPS
jgi:hypothetical protein